jgi:hypothetical protein
VAVNFHWTVGVGQTLARHELQLPVMEKTSWSDTQTIDRSRRPSHIGDGIYHSNSEVDMLRPPHQEEFADVNGWVGRGVRIPRPVSETTASTRGPVCPAGFVKQASSTNDPALLHLALTSRAYTDRHKTGICTTAPQQQKEFPSFFFSHFHLSLFPAEMSIFPRDCIT